MLKSTLRAKENMAIDHTAEGYIEESVNNKLKTSKMIFFQRFCQQLVNARVHQIPSYCPLNYNLFLLIVIRHLLNFINHHYPLMVQSVSTSKYGFKEPVVLCPVILIICCSSNPALVNPETVGMICYF